MKYLQRSLLPVAGLAVAAFVVAGLAGNHHSGLRGSVADVAWISFVLIVPVVIVLAFVVLVGGAVSKRRSTLSEGGQR